jgi:hypothetical protein
MPECSTQSKSLVSPVTRNESEVRRVAASLWRQQDGATAAGQHGAGPLGQQDEGRRIRRRIL